MKNLKQQINESLQMLSQKLLSEKLQNVLR